MRGRRQKRVVPLAALQPLQFCGGAVAAQASDAPGRVLGFAAGKSVDAVESIADTLVAVVRDVPFFGAEAASDASVTLCVDAHMVVSARTRQLKAIDHLRAAVKAGAAFDSPVQLLA